MRAVGLLLIYFFGIFLGAALIAPWVYYLFQSLAEGNSAFQPWANYPFHRFVHRCLLFLAIFGLWPFLRSLGIRQWKDLGLTPVALHYKKAPAGFLIGFGSLAAFALMAVFFGARTIHLRHTGNTLALDLVGATFTAIVVAFLEESLFRGVLFGALRKNNPWPHALFLSSAIYALLHFFGKPETPIAINWSSGFVTLASMFGGFADWEMLVPKLFNLFIVGVILGFAFQRTGNLYFSIGLHAGWIFWLKSYGLLTKKTPEMTTWIWGRGKIIDGWLATVVLLFVFGFLFISNQNKKRCLDVA